MLILWSFFAALVAIFHFGRVSPLRFDYFSTLVWLAALSVNAIGMVTFPPLGATTIWFVVGCHLALLAGYRLTGAKSGGGYVYAGGLGFRTQILALLSVIFIVLAVGRGLLEGQLPFVGALTRLQEARTELWARGAENASIADQLVRLFSYAATAYVILLPLIFREIRAAPNSRKGGFIIHLILAMGACAFIMDQALRDAGRALIVYIALSVGSVYVILFPLNLKKAVLFGFGGIIMIYLLGVTFYQYRNQNFYRSPQAYIELNCAGGRPEAWVLRGSDALPAAAVSACYFASPVYNLDSFLKNNSGSWKHTYGLYNASIISGESFVEIREDLAWYYRLLGQGQNPWATAARDYWLDWSWWSILAFVVTGAIFGWLSRKRVFRTETDLIRFGLIVIAAFFVPFLSPLINRPMIYPIIVTLLVDLVASASKRGGSPTSRNYSRPLGRASRS